MSNCAVDILSLTKLVVGVLVDLDLLMSTDKPPALLSLLRRGLYR